MDLKATSSSTSTEPSLVTDLDNEPDKDADINPSGTIMTSISLYYTLFIISFILFELLRRKWEDVYACRKYREETTFPVAEKRYGILGWIVPALRTSDDDIFQHCGLDTLCFLRLLRMAQKLSLGGMFLSVFLFPSYATGTNPREDSREDIDPLERITMSNLSKNETRLWASVVGMYLMTFFAFYLLHEEYKVYVRRRHEFLGREGPQQYSVIVNYLPKMYRSKETLMQYMEYLFPNTVRAVHVALQCSKLENQVEERAEVRSKLEHVLKVYDSTGKRPTHQTLRCGSPVDSIQFYQERLAELNTKVASEINRLKSFEIEIGKKLLEARRKSSLIPVSSESGQGDVESPLTPSNGHQSPKKLPRIKTIMMQSAFVSFTTLRSAQVAQQLLQTEDPFKMAISPAPHPKDLVWKNIGTHLHERRAFYIFSWLATFLIILFWTIPTAFVASLATVETLESLIPQLEDVFKTYPSLRNLLKQISPLALVVMPVLASFIFGILSKKEGHPSLTQANASHFTKLVYFQTFQIFFVSVIAGTVLDSLTQILKQPPLILTLLGSKLPTQSTNFMAYLIIQMGLKLSLELLRVVPIGIGVIYSLFAPSLTKREKESSWFGLTPPRIPGEFIQTLQLADFFLAILLLFSFCSIAPLLCYFAGIYFLMSDIVYRRQLFFVYDPSKYTTGVYWPKLHNCLVGALLLAQITFLGLVTLKVTPGPIVGATILPFFTISYYVYVDSLWPIAASNLPLSQCCNLDVARSGKGGSDWEFLDNVYEQPALGQAEPISPENETSSESQFELVNAAV